MIPVISDVVATPSNALETVQMTMDRSEESVLIAMRSMENNYTDSSGATVREYATNALDAHLEAGITRPIEITTPTAENPHYIVRDFGKGMTREFLTKNFSKYRFSTKRDNKNANGMYGLGSKAALSEVNAFSIESVSEGYKTFARIYKSENGSNVSILAHDKTDEPSGTRIIINVGEYKVEEYRTKIREFFYFWDPETVLVDGSRPHHILEDNYQYVERFGYINNEAYRWNSTLRILQGNVVYSVNNLTDKQKAKLFSSFPALISKHVILEVPNGTLAYTDSREGIVNSSDNLAKIGRHIGNMFRFMFDNMEKDINAEHDAWRALNILESYTEMFGSKTMQGINYSKANLHLNLSPFEAYGWTSKQNRKALRDYEYSDGVNTDFKNILMLVTEEIPSDDDRKALTAMKPYVASKYNSSFPKVYRVKKSVYNGYKDDALFKAMVENEKITVLDTMEIVEWHKEYKIANRVNSPKAPRASGGTRTPITYPVRFHGESFDRNLSLEQLRDANLKRVFTYHEGNVHDTTNHNLSDFGFSLFSRKGDALVTISANRSTEVFERRSKGVFKVVPAVSHFKDKVANSHKTYTDTQRMMKLLSASGEIYTLVENLKENGVFDKIDSPFLKEFDKLRGILLEIETHNNQVNRCLPYSERKAPYELWETETFQDDLKARALEVCKHYGVLFFLFCTRSTNVHDTRIEVDWNEMVEMLNEHYAKNGDPKAL